MPEATAPAPPAAQPAAAPPPATKTEGTPPAAATWMTPPKPAEGTAPVPPQKTEAAPPPKTEAPPPAKIELKVPEGFKLEPADLGKYVSFASENGLSQAQAQKLLERDLLVQKSADEAMQGALKTQDARWLGELQGEWGAKFVENSELAKRGFDILDPDGELRKGIEKIGVAHWPKLVKAAHRLGAMAAEDKLHAPNAGKTQVKLSPEEQLKEQYKATSSGAKK